MERLYDANLGGIYKNSGTGTRSVEHITLGAYGLNELYKKYLYMLQRHGPEGIRNFMRVQIPIRCGSI